MQALEKAAERLALHPTALDCDDDVDAVGLTDKAAAKVREILFTGGLERVEEAKRDEKLQVGERGSSRGRAP